MKLFSRELERRLRKEALSRIRGGKALTREYKTFRSTWWKRANRQGSSLAVPLLILFALGWFTRLSSVPANAQALATVTIGAYSIGTALFRSSRFRTRTVGSWERVFFLHLPVSDEFFLNWEWRHFWKSWTWAAVVFVAAFIILIYSLNALNTVGILCALLAGVLQAGVAMSLGLMILTIRPRWTKVVIALPFYLVIIACWWRPEIARALSTPFAVLPIGWIPFALSQAGIWNNYRLVWPMLAAGMFSAVGVVLVRTQHAALLRELAQHDEFRSHTTEEEDAGDQEHLPSPETTAQPGELDRVLAERLVSGLVYLLPLNLAAGGWIEKLVARVLSEDDLGALAFMLGDQLPTWSKQFRVAIFVAIGGAVITVLPLFPNWMAVFGAIISSMIAMPVLGGVWAVFTREFRSGFSLPMYIAAPISSRRIFSVVMKVNFVRIALWTPIVLAYGALLAPRLGENPYEGVLNGLRTVIVLVLAQPITLLGKYSQGTNDTKRFLWEVLLSLLVALFLAGGFVTGLIAIYAASTWLIEILAVTGMAACSVLLYSGYMRLLSRGRIDLLSVPSGR